MSLVNGELMRDVKEELYKHGKLSILIYKVEGDWIIHRWGEYERLSEIHEKVFNKYRLAGFDEEANSLTLMELPKDEDVIYNILTTLSLENQLQKIGFTLR